VTTFKHRSLIHWLVVVTFLVGFTLGEANTSVSGGGVLRGPRAFDLSVVSQKSIIVAVAVGAAVHRRLAQSEGRAARAVAAVPPLPQWAEAENKLRAAKLHLLWE
jgi:hypothetical protein